jgi:transcriptional regulator with XRE-family HTH domain
MVRPPLTHLEHARGERLGMLLRVARGSRSMAEIAAVSGVPAETLRKIETGRIATPAFFTVAALAGTLGLALEEIAQACISGTRRRGSLTSHRIRLFTEEISAGRWMSTGAALVQT